MIMNLQQQDHLLLSTEMHKEVPNTQIQNASTSSLEFPISGGWSTNKKILGGPLIGMNYYFFQVILLGYRR